MKIQYASDLHLEMPKNNEYLKAHPLLPSGDLLILAGDVVPFSLMDKHNDFFSYISDNFRETFWIPGNHEYYRSEITERKGTVHEKIRLNIHLVNNMTHFSNNIRMIFTTLWSHIQPGYQWEIEKSVEDFQNIRFEGNRLTYEHFNELHEECLHFLQAELNEKNYAKTIVITHHAPTLQHYPSDTLPMTVSGAYATELSGLIAKSNADCWIYGHLHHNVPDYYIGKTKMLTNSMGFVEFAEHTTFKNDKVVKI